MARRVPGTIPLVLAVALAGCGPAAPTTSDLPVGASPTAPSPGASSAPSASPAPAVAKRFTFDNELVVSTALAGSKDKFINPGAVIEADGTLHMFPNVFSAFPGRTLIPHLTSTDGLTWTLDEDSMPLDSEDFALAGPGIDISTGFIADDGTWVLVYETVSSTVPWVLGRVRGPGPEGPWTIDDTPILTEGGDGAFDHGGVQWPSVVKAGERWALYFTGVDAPRSRKSAIGVAFSTDGVTWTREPEPVLTATEDWELGSLDRPRVVQTPSGLVMLYTGLDLNKRALATSTDGLAWTKVPGPNLEQEDFPITSASWDAALLYRAGQLEYFLEIGSMAGTDVYRATLAWP